LDRKSGAFVFDGDVEVLAYDEDCTGGSRAAAGLVGADRPDDMEISEDWSRDDGGNACSGVVGEEGAGGALAVTPERNDDLICDGVPSLCF
jgi:hypothetical protein